MENLTTLEKIDIVAKKEFLTKGFKSASLRNIVREADLTTGAFYGYYKSKEELFEKLVGEEYDYIINSYSRLIATMKSNGEGIDNTEPCLIDMLHYAYAHLDEFKMLLVAAEGTRFEGFIDQIVDVEVNAKDTFSNENERTGNRNIDDKLEHMLITGMFHTFFEVIIHDVSIEEAEHYVREMHTFYSAGFKSITLKNNR